MSFLSTPFIIVFSFFAADILCNHKSANQRRLSSGNEPAIQHPVHGKRQFLPCDQVLFFYCLFYS